MVTFGTGVQETKLCGAIVNSCFWWERAKNRKLTTFFLFSSTMSLNYYQAILDDPFKKAKKNRNKGYLSHTNFTPFVRFLLYLSATIFWAMNKLLSSTDLMNLEVNCGCTSC